MDLASLIGMIVGFVLVVFGIYQSAESIAGLRWFLDPPSALITFGGAVFATMTSCTMPNFVGGLKSIGLIFKPVSVNIPEMITKIIELSNIARKEGLLSLEEAAGNLEDDFMKKGIMLIVDGTDQELVSSILETELNCIEQRHNKVCNFWDGLAAMGPAWGMIGTLIGLINMLKLLDDPSSIGPNMAVALITTLYGSLIANWICIPVATKLRAKNQKEIMNKEVICEGILSIQAGENPRVIEEKLKSFLAPAMRNEVLGGEGESKQGGDA